MKRHINELSGEIIGCAYNVSNVLGAGFLEKVYENALAMELREAGLDVRQQRGILVSYKERSVGHYCADLIEDETVIIEIKAAVDIAEAHVAQCLNYLKATGLPLCLLLNFGTPRVQIKRLAGENLPQMNTDDHR